MFLGAALQRILTDLNGFGWIFVCFLASGRVPIRFLTKFWQYWWSRNTNLTILAEIKIKADSNQNQTKINSKSKQCPL